MAEIGGDGGDWRRWRACTGRRRRGVYGGRCAPLAHANAHAIRDTRVPHIESQSAAEGLESSTASTSVYPRCTRRVSQVCCSQGRRAWPTGRVWQLPTARATAALQTRCTQAVVRSLNDCMRHPAIKSQALAYPIDRVFRDVPCTMVISNYRDLGSSAKLVQTRSPHAAPAVDGTFTLYPCAVRHDRAESSVVSCSLLCVCDSVSCVRMCRVCVINCYVLRNSRAVESLYT